MRSRQTKAVLQAAQSNRIPSGIRLFSIECLHFRKSMLTFKGSNQEGVERDFLGAGLLQTLGEAFRVLPPVQIGIYQDILRLASGQPIEVRQVVRVRE